MYIVIISCKLSFPFPSDFMPTYPADEEDKSTGKAFKKIIFNLNSLHESS